MYQFNDFKNIYNVSGTFLDYMSLLIKLPREWMNKINQNRILCQNINWNVARNCYIKYLTKNKKGSKVFYDTLTGTKAATLPSRKWINIIGIIG